MVKILVKVKPGSKQDSVERIDEASYVVRVKAKAIEGKANDAVIKLLCLHFNVPRAKISVIKGLKSRDKVIGISG